MGKLIVFEGPDGTGKSTLAKNLLDQLAENENRFELLGFPGNEKGEIGNLVYRLHHNPEEFGIDSVTDAALQTMHIAAHIDAIERKLLPWLDEGVSIILDRYWWSTWAYGRLANMSPSTLERLIDVERSFWGTKLPDLVFLVDADKPFRKETNLKKWRRLRTIYKELVVIETGKYPIEILSNDKNIVDTIGKVTVLLNKHKVFF